MAEEQRTNWREYFELIKDYTDKERRDTILNGLDELFRFGTIKDDNIQLYYAYLKLREIYPNK